MKKVKVINITTDNIWTNINDWKIICKDNNVLFYDQNNIIRMSGSKILHMETIGNIFEFTIE